MLEYTSVLGRQYLEVSLNVRSHSETCIGTYDTLNTYHLGSSIRFRAGFFYDIAIIRYPGDPYTTSPIVLDEAREPL